MRLTLNGAENTRTFAGHFIAEAFGSAVQHLAFATRDIFATAAALTDERLRDAGDLPATTTTTSRRASASTPTSPTGCRAANILYDRDEHGEYFQLYSPNFGEGFFFEIVERRGGYRGYGAPNAPFRIAAQKRHLRPQGIPRR